ncbi:MAG: cyclodeaminase/cyclohydrolase family protein [Eubacteriales bacterium]|nr:cyclodeaminase/cyclohydrolase family protein [Eubacteriales bacterium]MDD4323703.1 cyclodeaminase/cyclohydrolase family protein [Eubacteriales bacterium]MDD4541317.1 cyclodeaminase/cyclohydrolase family protein [Eubacteriales bacterium]
MTKLKDLSVESFIAETASDSPAPGGGSVAALVAALGAALGEMVYNLTKNKKSFAELSEENKTAVKADYTALSKLHEELISLIDEDTVAFNTFMDALRLPKETNEEIAARKEAMAHAAIVSMQVPLDTAGKSLEILKHMGSLARYGSKNCISDAGVGAYLARAAVESAVMNVRINLSSVKDEDVAGQAENSCQNYLKEAEQLCNEIIKEVYQKI